MAGLILLRPMDFQGVFLTQGRARRQFEEALDYFMELPDDDILYGFRRRAGLAHPGRELGGWYSNDGSFDVYDWDEIFNTFGQWLGFFAKAYALTDSKAVLAKLENLIHEWGMTLEEDGYFFYSRNNNAWHYSFEKIMAGLTDAMVYAQSKEARKLLLTITKWAQKNLPEFKNTPGKDRASFTGGERSIGGIDNEWYTLPENLYRAYLATGEEIYREFAGKWLYESYYENMRNRDASCLAGVHGYSHVNTLCSAAMAYQVTGEKRYLETIENAYEVLMEGQVFASGGFAFDEHMAQGESNCYTVEDMARSFEVPCSSYAVLKLTRYLLMFTGNARYGDWAERILYNALFASLPMKDDERRRGKTFYYADYRLGGGRKVYYEHSFPCCSGTYPQAMAEYHNLIYFLTDRELYLTQYLPSRLDIPFGGGIRLEIVTDYPESEKVTVVFGTDMDLALKLRMPTWLPQEEISLEVNGVKYRRRAQAGRWLELKRDWKAGDRLEIWFPMKLYTLPLCANHPERAALMYGPVMLAAKGRHKRISADAANPSEDIARTGRGLNFCTGDRSVEFSPYWEYGEKEWSSVYLDYKKNSEVWYEEINQ